MRTKKAFKDEIKSIFHHFRRGFSSQKLSQTWNCAFKKASGKFEEVFALLKIQTCFSLQGSYSDICWTPVFFSTFHYNRICWRMLDSVEIETTHFSPIFYLYTPENVRKAKVFRGDFKQTLNFFNSTVFYDYNIRFL